MSKYDSITRWVSYLHVLAEAIHSEKQMPLPSALTLEKWTKQYRAGAEKLANEAIRIHCAKCGIKQFPEVNL